MQTETKTFTHCQNCGRWFEAGFRFATAEAFEDSKIEKSTRICPFCKKATPVEKQYLRFDMDRIDGRITHIEGKYFA